MAWYERLLAVLRREGRDAADAVKRVGRSIDEALAEKERELAASPTERIDMLLEESKEADADFEQLEERIRRRTGSSEENDG